MKYLNLTIIALLFSVASFATIGPITGTSTLCIASMAPLSDTTGGGTWTSSTPGTASIGSATGVVAGVAAGTATITYTVGASYVTTTVTVFPLPHVYTLYTPGSGAICGGTGADLLLSGSDPGTSYQLFFGGTPLGGAMAGYGSILDFGPQTTPGSYSATATSTTTACVSIMSGPVTLFTLPSPAPIAGASAVCVGSAITLTDTTSGGTWSSSRTAKATISTSGVVSGIDTGTTVIHYTVPSGCAATTTINVVNLVSPISGTSTLCSGATATLTDGSGGGAWTSTNPAAATINPSSGFITGVAAGTTTISYTVGGTCGSVSSLVTVHTSPAVVTGITSVCAGGTTSLGDTSPGGTWSSSNPGVGTVSTGGIVTALAGGSSTISYTLAGCASTTVLSVDPPPTISGASTLCVGSTATLSAAISSTWNSSNPFVGSISGSGTLTGVAPGSVVITATALSTGCVSTRTISVTSSCTGTPTGGTAHAGSTLVCADNYDLLYVTGATSTCGVGYQWQSSSDSVFWANVTGATGDSVSINPQATLYYRCKVMCFTSGLFGYSSGVKITVYNSITGHSIINTPSVFCNGPDFQISTCGVQLLSNIVTYYGDGTHDTTHVIGVTTDISHSYNLSGTYTVKQLLLNGSVAQDSVTSVYTYSYCRTIPVTFYFDANSDCTDDAGDGETFSPVTTEVDSNGVPVDTITTYNGFFYSALGAPGSVYRFKVIGTDAGLHVTCPAGGILYDTVSSFMNTYATNYFGLNCTGAGSFDLAVTATSISGRHTAEGSISVRNNYCTPENPVVTMTFSPRYTFGSAYPAPFSVSGNTATWHLAPLSVHNSTFSAPTIYYTLNVPGPFLTAGDTVRNTYTIAPMVGDVVPANNTFVLIDTIRASFDPNGITVMPGGMVIPCAPLQYTIRFENTGNDTAHNISVVDTLSDNLNASSLQVVSATSVLSLATTSYSGHTVVKFDFPAINLPDSAHHNQCIGWLTFTIKSKAGLADGTTVTNHASVYFDDARPVMTDTAINVIGVSAITGTNNVCTGGTLSLADASAGGVWSSSSGIASVAGGLVTTLSAGADTIYYTVSNTCGSKAAMEPITINPILAPAVSINSSTGMSDSICTGTVPTFIAVAVNGGTTPIWQWEVNGVVVGTDSSYTYVPIDGDVITAELTSNALCAAPDTAMDSMTLRVLPPNVPMDSLIAMPGILISHGTADTFMAIVTSGGGATYEWLLNGAPTGDTTSVYISSTLANNDSITCITTSTDQCRLSSVNSTVVIVTTVDVQNLNAENGIMIYPNPNNGTFVLKGSLEDEGEVALEITDMMGRVIYQTQLVINGKTFEQRIVPASALANGMYLLNVRSQAESQVLHFVVGQ